MKSTLEKYLTILENLGEYFFLSLLLAISATLLLESWRKNLRYLVASVVFGTLLGYGVMHVEAISSFAVLATIAGTITGPTTVMAFQKKSLFDAAKELKDTADLVMQNKSRSSGGYPYPRRSSDARKLPTQGGPYDQSY